MKKTLIAAVTLSLMSSASFAETIGVSIARFDDNFLTVMRNGMEDYASGIDGVDLVVEDAQDDVARQLDQINNFIASGVDAIIVNAVDTSATEAMSAAAAAAGVPLVDALEATAGAAGNSVYSKAILQIDPGEPPFIDASRCYGCRACIPACPHGAITLNGHQN